MEDKGLVSQQGGSDHRGCGCGGGAAGSAAPQPVYAIGQIRARFPSPGLERELAQVLGRSETGGLSDSEALYTVLSKRENRYLVRRLCWVMSIEGIDTYLLLPRDHADLDYLVGAMRPGPRLTDVDVVIGLRGPIAPPTMCNGLQVPIVTVEQVYSFDMDQLLKAIPRPEGIAPERFGAASEEVLSRVLQMADNAGATDAHRALNYLAVRYPAIYATTADAHGRNASLAAVEVRPSTLAGLRTVLDVIFTFVHRATDVSEKYFVRVDVSEMFPFLVTKMSPYYDR